MVNAPDNNGLIMEFYKDGSAFQGYSGRVS